MHNGEVLAVFRAGLLDGTDAQLQADQAEGFAGGDGRALFVSRDDAALEIEGVQIVVVEEADNTHPGAADAVGVEGVQVRAQSRLDRAGQGIRYEAVGRDAGEGVVPGSQDRDGIA